MDNQNIIQFPVQPEQFQGRILGILPGTGAQIIAQSNDVVLCLWRGEYVTWRTDKDGNAWSGHYYRNYETALADFKERI